MVFDFPENALTTEVERGKIAFTVGIIVRINWRRGDGFEQFDLAHEDVFLGLFFGLVIAAKVVEHSVCETDAGRGVHSGSKQIVEPGSFGALFRRWRCRLIGCCSASAPMAQKRGCG